MTINSRIKDLRKKLGFTQAEFGEKISLWRLGYNISGNDIRVGRS